MAGMDLWQDLLLSIGVTFMITLAFLGFRLLDDLILSICGGRKSYQPRPARKPSVHSAYPEDKNTTESESDENKEIPQ